MVAVALSKIGQGEVIVLSFNTKSGSNQPDGEVLLWLNDTR
jgi:hypothetical protein